MCGICGKLQFDDEKIVRRELVERMMTTLSHRGPDGRGVHCSGPVGLGHTRLAIIDVGGGAQPISNEDATVWLVYNGELYNFVELRDELIGKGHRFKTHSDTEVIVHAYEEYGVECLSRLRGMFAFAIWDERRRSLFVARDRVGIKPLFYTNTGKALVFASEIKALLADPDVDVSIDAQSIDKFLTHFCLPGAETLWKGIFKLEPGTYLMAQNGKVSQQRYWDLHFNSSVKWKSLEDAAEATYEIVKKTVREHMISDVPVGFLLSGGVDSTVVLSCAATETAKAIKTFTVGFDRADFEDERPYARLASERFGSEHHEITFDAEDFWEFLPSLVERMEEPVCDPPAVSLHYVSKLAQQHVKVLLSGEGGDEAFGGYGSYKKFLKIERAKKLVRPLNGNFSWMLSAVGGILGSKRLKEASPYFRCELSDYYYSRVASPFSYFSRNKRSLYTGDFYGSISSNESTRIVGELFRNVRNESALKQMLYLDTKTSLPDDLLVKADRITMGNSLELRVPFLDHNLLQFAAGLPDSFKVCGTSTKRVLKEAFKAHIPSEVINRKKAGFPLPLTRWVGGELKERIREVLLSPEALGRQYFSRKGIEDLLDASATGGSFAKETFSLLTLELLLRSTGSRASVGV
jgi:asparagine synthase (glutamine-hydrolysing)